jgi:hypothetical protein
VELWYLDKNELTFVDYSREDALNFIKPFERRALKIETAQKADIFEANPNVFSCQYCPYGPTKGGQCKFGVTQNMSISDYRKKFL